MRLAAALAALALHTHAHAQQGWPEEPMVAGIGFDTCGAVLAAPDDAARRTMVAQWTFGLASGLLIAGAETDDPRLAGLDAGMKNVLRDNNPAALLNDRVIAACRGRTGEPLAAVAVSVLEEIAGEGRR